MMTTASFDYDYDHDEMVIDQYSDPFYPPSIYNHPIVPEQQKQQHQPAGESKTRRRRRKKNRGDDVETSGNGIMMMRKRKLSEEQVNLLELSFDQEHMLESDRKDRLASELGLDPRQVAVWFQNRRARWKSKKLEEEYCRLKSVLEITVLDKCKLEIEVLKLKQQLSESVKEIQILMESNSTITHDQGSSYNFSMPQPFLGLQGMEDDFHWCDSFSFYQS